MTSHLADVVKCVCVFNHITLLPRPQRPLPRPRGSNLLPWLELNKRIDPNGEDVGYKFRKF